MARHLDEMQSYIKIAESIGLPDDVVLSDDLQPPEELIDPYSNLVEDLHDIVFKLKSYREINEDQNYALGIEEGLSLAAEMISRLLEKQNQEND